MSQAAGARGKLIFQVIVPVLVITLLSAGLQMAVTFFLMRFLNSEIKSGIRSEFE
jgi:hypothetical protein